MGTVALLAYAAWCLLAIILFATLGRRQAIVYTIIGGWMFLPVGAWDIPGLPRFDKTAFSCLLATIFAFALGRKDLSTSPPPLRVSLVDVLMGVWCICPFFSSIFGGYGVTQGISATLIHVFHWGLPYALGRIAYRSQGDASVLIRCVVVLVVLYLPLVWFELRMSPNLHHYVYGYAQHVFAQTRRMGGWRPQVFLQHGLALGLLLSFATVMLLSLYRQRDRRAVFGIPIGWLFFVVLVTCVLAKSIGAILLMLGGVVVVLMPSPRARALALVVLALAPSAFVLTRVTGIVSAEGVVESVEGALPEDRIKSWEFRLRTEDRLLQKAEKRFWLGWGPWGAFRMDAAGADVVKATDGLWIIVLGRFGTLGLGALVLILALGVLKAKSHLGRRGLFACGLCVGMFGVDMLLNALSFPLVPLLVGVTVSSAWQSEARGHRA